MLRLDLDIDLINVYIIIFLLLVATAYALFDVNYFIRIAITIGYGMLFEKKIKITEKSEIHSIAITGDMDLFLTNMSNSRYIREADFGRFHFLERSGLYKAATNAKAHIVQGACNVRFRRPISLFTPFKVTTRVIYWDEKNLYFEQQFITKDGFIRAVAISQNKIVGTDVGELMGKLLEKDASYRLEIPAEIKHWVTSMEESSNRLRNKAD